MRWPLLGGAIAGFSAISTDGIASITSTFIAGSIIGGYGLTKLLKKQICNCEDDGYMKLSDTKVEWIVEYDAESGSKRPWEVYSMFGGLQFTKQHYASYSTEEHALNKIEILKKKKD
jgi:hypothetical protein